MTDSLKEFTITRATSADVHRLVELVNSAYRGETSRQGWTTEAELLDGIRIDEETMRKLLDDQDATILKYLNKEGELIGCVYLQQKDTKMYLGMLTVSPIVQTNGIGKQLMKAAEEYALQNKCSLIEMTVITVRNELISWYERRGYSKTGETKPFPDDPRFGIPKQPLEFHVMKKRLQE